MPESDKESKVTREEAKSLLTGLANKVTGSNKGSSPTPQSSFPVAIIVSCVVVLGFAIMGFLLMRAKRKAAKLASELRRKEEDHAQAVEDKKLAESEEVRREASQRAHILQLEVESLEIRITKLREANKSRRETIAELANWDDLEVVDKR